jgi:hypothetical protein
MPDYPSMKGLGKKVEKWKRKIKKDREIMTRIREIVKLQGKVREFEEKRDELVREIDGRIEMKQFEEPEGSCDDGRAGDVQWNGTFWFELLGDPYVGEKWAVDFLARFVVMVKE